MPASRRSLFNKTCIEIMQVIDRLSPHERKLVTAAIDRLFYNGSDQQDIAEARKCIASIAARHTAG